MSKLTGSIAPIDHGLTVTLRVTRKSIMFISSQLQPVTNRLLVCGAGCRVGRAVPMNSALPQGQLITSGGRSSTTNTSRRAVLRPPMTG
jgi:hypothetical protein